MHQVGIQVAEPNAGSTVPAVVVVVVGQLRIV